MGKVAPDAVLDAGLDVIALSTRMIACSAEPASYNDAVNVVDLATAVVAPGDFAKANDTSGRKLTVSAKPTITIDHTGQATHVALVSVGDTTLRYVTTCTAQQLTAAGTVDFPSWKINNTDPT